MLRRLISWSVMLAILVFGFASPVWAGDVSNGAKLFASNCASCHIGGGNIINRSKTLSNADLTKYGMNSLQAIVTQITNGKPPMPSFKARLKADQIEDVASYVLATAEKGW